MTLLHRIERFLKASDMAPASFGRQVANDPKLVSDLRKGRQPHAKLIARVDAFLDRQYRNIS